MRQVPVSTSLVHTVHAMLTSGLMVLASLVVLQTQLVSSASAEVTFLNKWGSSGSSLTLAQLQPEAVLGR